jgi:hypothetical protein
MNHARAERERRALRAKYLGGVCDVRLNHGETTIAVDDLRLHDECAEELARQIQKLT